MSYGNVPEEVGLFQPEWHEYMHYLYLPVAMPEAPGLRLPPNLAFMEDLVLDLIKREGVLVEAARDGFSAAHRQHGILVDQYVYVTARRGHASPGNPLNRPGWHTDGFGTDDINYIWSDAWPTRFATGDLDLHPEADHIESVEQWTRIIDHYRHMGGADSVKVHRGENDMVYRLDSSVIHATPIITGSGDRSFFKISVSNDKYNLLGNSHNYLFDYDWKMWKRSEIRNDPAYAGGDAGPREVAA